MTALECGCIVSGCMRSLADMSEFLCGLQSLQALEKISHEHPTACLRAGALMAVLSYLDFFSTGVQVSIGDGCSNWGVCRPAFSCADSPEELMLCRIGGVVIVQSDCVHSVSKGKQWAWGAGWRE